MSKIEYMGRDGLVTFATRDEAEIESKRLSDAISDIKKQLDEAILRKRENLACSDSGWFHAAKLSIGAHRIELRELMASIKRHDALGANQFDAATFLGQRINLLESNVFPDDLQACEALEIHLLRNIASLKVQIARTIEKVKADKKAKVKTDLGRLEWLTSAERALKIKGAQHQALNCHKGGLKRKYKQEQHERNQARQDTFHSLFVRVAAGALPKNTFDALMNEASSRFEAAHQCNATTKCGETNNLDLQPGVCS